jgi:hypothetical protein
MWPRSGRNFLARHINGRFMNSIRFAVLLLATLSVSPALADELTPEQLSFFETKIRPVLIRECYGCHSNKSGNVRGGLRLDSKELMLIGGATGPAIVPGDLEESWLYNAITHQDYVMPPKRKLPQSIINDFRKWIEMGAPDPRVNTITKINSKITKEDIQQAKDSFWAYQKPVKNTPPAIDNASWPRSDVDRFVLAKLEQAELKPAADAEPWKVLRTSHRFGGRSTARNKTVRRTLGSSLARRCPVRGIVGTRSQHDVSSSLAVSGLRCRFVQR